MISQHEYIIYFNTMQYKRCKLVCLSRSLSTDGRCCNWGCEGLEAVSESSLPSCVYDFSCPHGPKVPGVSIEAAIESWFWFLRVLYSSLSLQQTPQVILTVKVPTLASHSPKPTIHCRGGRRAHGRALKGPIGRDFVSYL